MSYQMRPVILWRTDPGSLKPACNIIMRVTSLVTSQSRLQERHVFQTDRRTDGRYQIHYLPRFAVDKNASSKIQLSTDAFLMDGPVVQRHNNKTNLMQDV